MKRSLIALMVLICLVLCACDPAAPALPAGTTGSVSASTPSSSQTRPTTVPSATEPTSVPDPTQPTTVPLPDPLFAGMPQMYSDFAEVYMTEHFAVFVFTTAGMDSADTTVVTYDLQRDALLGQVSLGEDQYSIFPWGDEGFCVLSLYQASCRIYDSDCSLVSEGLISGFEGGFGFAGVREGYLLLSDMITGKVFVYDLPGMHLIETDLVPGVYQYVGGYGLGFLLESYDQGLILVGFDGSSQVLYKNGSAQVVGSTYAAGIRGDYITMLPLMDGDPVMAPCQTSGEIFVAADGVSLLSRSQNWDSEDYLYYYAADSMTVSSVSTGGQIVGAGVADGCAVAVVRMDGSQPLQFVYVDFSNYEKMPIGKTAYDNGILNGAEPLPEPAGSDETVTLIRRLYQEHGVRIMYEPDVFDLEPLGYVLTPTDEASAYTKALLLEQFLDFLPDGLFLEMGQKAPVVIYLCQDVYPTAGGMHTFLNGYNVVFLSVTGSDDYFLNVVAHEMGHALELEMDPEVVALWRELMPPEVQSAYVTPALTVEFTPDDKGRTPVWFLEAYSRTSEKEDRAVLFAALFDAWRSGDYSFLQYEGLRLKANCWAQMLRQTYDCCEDAIFPWEIL